MIRIVVLGMMTKMPVPGVVWQTIHYLVGLQRLGYDVHYVEAHGRAPSMFMRNPDDDGACAAAAFLARVLRPFGFRDRWAFHALHADGRCWGMPIEQLHRLYDSAALLINLHGGTTPLPEHTRNGRLVFLETDPVQVQLQLAHGCERTNDFLSQHCAFFTFGENYGRDGCTLPVSDRFEFRATRQPVVLDLWEHRGNGAGASFSTIGNWRQSWRAVRHDGELYRWSKHLEFLKVIELPQRTAQLFELALASFTPDDRRLLEEHGWRVRNADDVAQDIGAYRRYIAASRGEFTVAKDQNIRFRSGWFSDRSATYLAAGRPVITQETGFSSILPTGAGLFAFSTLDDAVAAVAAINAEWPKHSRAARDIAREHFSYDVVLPPLLASLDVRPSTTPAGGV